MLGCICSISIQSGMSLCLSINQCEIDPQGMFHQKSSCAGKRTHSLLSIRPYAPRRFHSQRAQSHQQKPKQNTKDMNQWTYPYSSSHTEVGDSVRDRMRERDRQNHHHRSRHRKDEEKKEELADGCNTYLCIETRNKPPLSVNHITQNHLRRFATGSRAHSTSGGCGSKNTCLQNSRNRMLVAYAHWRKKASCRRRPRRCGCRKINS